MNEKIYQAAKKLLEEGCSVIPIKKGEKAPLVEWKVYQTRRPTEVDLYRWFFRADNQLGLVTGNVSGGRFILDFDGSNWEESFSEFISHFPEFDSGCVVETGGGQAHIHGICPDMPSDLTKIIKKYWDNEGKIIGKVELRANEHQTLVPPSIHPSGGVYHYANGDAPPAVITRKRLEETIAWMEEGQREKIISSHQEEETEIEELTPEQKSEVANYYLRRMTRQVLIGHEDRNNKGYELARDFNNLRLPKEEARNLMLDYAHEVPQWGYPWSEKDPYTKDEAQASLDSAYNNKPGAPWIPWSFQEKFKIQNEFEDPQSAAEFTENEAPKEVDLTLPRNIFRGLIKEIADLYYDKMESPYEYWVFTAACFLGNVFCQRIRIETALNTEPRLYVVNIGSSGDARKSECRRQMRKLFKEFFDLEDRGLEPEESDEDTGVEEHEPIYRVNTCLGAGSAEGLISFLKTRHNTILIQDEFRTFIQKSAIKGSILLEATNSLFDDTFYENITKDSHLKADNAHLSLLAYSTLDMWDEMFSSTFTNMGFINRLWIVPGKETRRVAIPVGISSQEKALLYYYLDHINQSFSSLITLDWDQEAEERYTEWYEDYERTEFTKRLFDTYALRFMQIFCLSENKTIITLDIVERVIRLVEWQKKIREIHWPGVYDTREAWMEGRIIKNLREASGRMLRRDLYRVVHADRCGQGLFDKVLKSLRDSYRIRCWTEKGGDRGRPKEWVELVED